MSCPNDIAFRVTDQDRQAIGRHHREDLIGFSGHGCIGLNDLRSMSQIGVPNPGAVDLL